MKTTEIIPFEASHPGALLDDEMKARGIKQKNLAMELGVLPNFLNEIIKGKRPITADFAILLEKCLEIPAEYWMRFQTQYDIDLARVKQKTIQKTQEIETWKTIKQYIPVATLEKRDYLKNTLSERIAKIFEIFEIDGIDGLIKKISIHKNKSIYEGHFKKSEKLNNDQINIFAWCKLSEWLAKSECTPPFKPENKDDIITELKLVFQKNLNPVSETQNILVKNGIKFLIVEKFDKTPIDGYSFWSGNNPAIVLTLRKKSLDSFVFNVLHELAHIFKHINNDKNEEFIDLDFLKDAQNEKEIEANQFAQDCLMPKNEWQIFLNENETFNYQTTESKIVEFASKFSLHPSVVLGRYCFDTNQFKVKTKIPREMIIPIPERLPIRVGGLNHEFNDDQLAVF